MANKNESYLNEIRFYFLIEKMYFCKDESKHCICLISNEFYFI